jgi:hypothetical protein
MKTLDGADTPVGRLGTKNLAFGCAGSAALPYLLACATKRIHISLHLLLAAIREIFDESAYERFLQRRHLPANPETYAAFLRETECARQRRPRCC